MTASISDELLNQKEKIALGVVLLRLAHEPLETRGLLCAIAILRITDQVFACPIPEEGDPAYLFYKKISTDLEDFTPKAWECLARKLSLDILNDGKPEVQVRKT